MAEEKKQEEKKQEEKKQEAAKQKPAKEAPAEASKAKEAKPTQGAEKKEKPKKSDVKITGAMQDIISSIEGMTVLELSGLVKALEDKFGVTAAQPVVAAAGMAGAAAPGAAAAEEKSTFTVVLASVGANKIQVIKEVRSITTLGLKEAKDLVESAPKPVKEAVPKEEAETVKKKLEAAGAKVELK